MIASNEVFERLAALATCLCAEIEKPEWGVPGVCFCGLVPGEEAVAEYSGDCASKCGMAWVRLVALYPSNILGAVDATAGNCGSGLGMDVEIGMLRCITVDEPSPEALLAATELQVADAMIMRSAVFCCEAIPTKDVILGAYTPLGPQGGLVGGAYLLSVGL